MFVISQVDENTRQPFKFWTGSDFKEELQTAKVYDSSELVREDAGNFQKQDYSVDFRVLKVSRQIEIAE